MVLPLIVINYFQANHKLTLGQSSLELESAEVFKSELLCNLEKLPWTDLHQKGYSVDVDVHEIAAFGVYKSGLGAVFVFPSGSVGKFSTCKKVYSNINISVRLNKNDTLVFHRDLNLIVKVNSTGDLKVTHIDNQTGKGFSVPTSLPNMYLGKSLETLVPSTKKIYAIGIQEASREVSTYIENYLLDFYSAK